MIMRAFIDKQIDVFLNAFGEKLTLTSGKSLLAIFEQETIAIETEAGFVETQERYFTTKSGNADYTDTFMYRNKPQEIYNITDDLSGMSNFYFRDHA